MVAELLGIVISVVDFIFNMINILVLAAILVSWVGADPNNQIVQIVRQTTEPMLRPFRKLTQRLPGPLDWSPLALMLFVQVAQKLIHVLLKELMVRL